MKTADFFYRLPPKLIAQKPVRPRDRSRLLIYKSKVITPRLIHLGQKVQKSKKRITDPRLKTGPLAHQYFYNLPRYLNRGDVLIFNDTKVFPARLHGKKESGGKMEILLLENKSPDIWTALLKPGRNAIGRLITIGPVLQAKVLRRLDDIFTLRFNKSGRALDRQIDRLGQAPTPPYIKTVSDLKEYQTIYAKNRGSCAAPTAGFHFTPELATALKKQGIQFEYVTLHVGLGTFQPVKETLTEQHQIHSEAYQVERATWERLRAARKAGRRLIAVGTTTTRVLETVASRHPIRLRGKTNIFLRPGYKFKMIDGLITNFHLPESTLLMLVAAFIGDRIKNPVAGMGLTREIYQTAVKNKYRFYSFGDAMLII